MKSHKLKKYKERVEFRKRHMGLSELQYHVVSRQLAENIMRDPVKLSKVIAIVSELLCDTKP